MEVENEKSKGEVKSGNAFGLCETRRDVKQQTQIQAQRKPVG